jgi:hypothetical protein
VYFGLDHDFKDANQRNCGNGEAGLSNYLRNPGLVRAVLVETWGNLFRDSANCTGCTRLWHAFRRNDESGTTDTFVTLMARKANLQAGGTATVRRRSQSAHRSLFAIRVGSWCAVRDRHASGRFVFMVTNPTPCRTVSSLGGTQYRRRRPRAPCRPPLLVDRPGRK